MPTDREGLARCSHYWAARQSLLDTVDNLESRSLPENLATNSLLTELLSDQRVLIYDPTDPDKVRLIRYEDLRAQVVSGELLAPVNTVAPVIQGDPTVGVQITAATGAWSGNPAPTITWQWLADDLPISGATSLTFTPTAEEEGAVLTLRETATNSVGSASVISAPTDPVAAALVADEIVNVFASMVEGAVVYLAEPGTSLVGGPAGLSIRSTGDIYLSDRDAFFDALPFVAETSDLDIGFIQDPADYFNMAQYLDNMHFWFDAADNRFLIVNEESSLVEEVTDKVDADRVARNDLYTDRRPMWVRDSQAGTNLPAIRYTPLTASQSGYGLFFQDSPIYAGLQSATLTANGITINTRWDNKYALQAVVTTAGNSVDGSLGLDAAITLADGTVAVGKMVVFTAIYGANGVFKFRINGTQVDHDFALGTLTRSLLGDNLDIAGVTFGVIFRDTSSHNTRIFDSAGLGNDSRLWKERPWKGDLFELGTIAGASDPDITLVAP